MNKLLTKIVGAALGVAMTVGVGVAVASNANRNFEPVSASPTAAFSFSRSSSNDSVTTGYGMILTNYKSDTDFYQDKNSTVGLDIGVKKSSGAIWTTTPTSISLTVKVGGGSTKDPLTNAVTANLIDANGDEIANTSVTVTTKVESKTGKDYTVSVPVANNAAGVMVHHTKESSYNVRVYTISLSYEAAASVTYNITTTGVVNGTVTGDSTIAQNASATITLVPNTGYKLPADSSSITVSNATLSNYDSTTGQVTISNPTDDVSVSVTLPTAASYSISTNLTNLSKVSGPTSMYENQTVSITLEVTDSSTYALPSSVTVTNAITHSYNSTTGVVTINGATGNVTITASAINKPSEEEEDFSTSSSWNVVTAGEEYSTTNDLITATWTKGTSGTAAGGYWGPARFYKNHVLTITAATGAGAVTTIKSIEFTTSSGSSGTPSVAYSDALYNSTPSVTKPTTNPGSIEKSKDDLIITYSMTGIVTEVEIVLANQSRIPSFKVVYEKDQSDVPLQSISATCSGVLVSQQVTPVVTFTPAGASNKTLTYAITSGSQYATIDSSTGLVTGIGAGTATITITPADTHASAIEVNVVVSALPAISTVTVGTKYAVTATLSSTNFELTGISTGGSYTYGTSTNYETDPTNSFPVRVVNGLYAHTVALEVEINSATKYLAFDNTNSNNNLAVVDSIDRTSCWIFGEENSKLVIRNVEVYARQLAATINDSIGRFACYQALSNTVITPTFEEIAETKTAKEHVQDFVDLYMHLSDYTGDGTGRCNDGEYAYYLTAKAGYNVMVRPYEDRASLFASDPDFAAAKARYERWAEFNNDAAPYDGNDTVVTPIHSLNALNYVASSSTNVAAIIAIVSVISLSAVAGFFLLRKRKEQ